ncbi:MAG TPA: class I adenylate-forming enzyme family protein [Alphaproteobacteria bacterium]|nr:class I adenylate-forming enzyme family protein [Alphaproteobacteria bacterium]MDP7429787.1 class I adenylate-forming enzyme family protein [Alphaproteobacteria bacterium]HJM51640.1 class I adenylate-forming enzyme family protein [Alphaproteobacteria bacterium]
MTELLPELALISDYVAHWARQRPKQAALVLDDDVVSYGEFEARVEAVSRALVAAGVGHGERIAQLTTPRPEFMVLYAAAARIGAIWLGLNPRARYDELAYIVGDSQPRLLFAMPELEGRDYGADMRRLLAETGSVEQLVMMATEAAEPAIPFEDFLALGTGIDETTFEESGARARPEDPALIVYTSGSTGRPKGAMLSQRGIVRTCLEQCRHWWAEPFRIIVNVPVNHVGGAVQGATQALVAGGTNVLMERFDAAAIPGVIAAHGITVMHQVPTMYQMILDRPEVAAHDLSSLEVVIWSGARCPAELIARLRRLAPKLFTSYGCTEVGGEVLYTAAGADDALLAEAVGRPAADFAVRLADAAGRSVEAGTDGEIQVKDAVVMQGYFGRAEESAAAFTEDGWLCTGDVARVREDGQWQIVGRLKEMFKSGGYNVYPREVELVLESHPGVAMAAVVGAPDALYDEVGFAFVAPEEGAVLMPDELAAFCRARLSNYKVPKRIFVEAALPLLPIGKIDKSDLGARARELVAAESRGGSG